ncbi:hypothetical protein Spb1_11660 [Planctopirus ephydatiae]|uniref:EF-hand domain-containing protein n=1 Tax=Planctopirus ephydatiae TaxID=2528019 RepID=A0A518GL66_9PLAN|nr:hypothetical protein [Planctopirus ephydatiae]QDV29286.1 hypothetical protein Spb1_11660 [Planctopirus ephydatiae]
MKNMIHAKSAQQVVQLGKDRKPATVAHPRQGSTLLIVLVLLGLLSILGVIFFTFARQEQSNAEYFSEAAKAPQELGLTGEVLFDFALEQIIVGTRPEYRSSALWSSTHSMVTNAMGNVQRVDSAGTGRVVYQYPDRHPFDGGSMRLSWNAGTLAIDNYLIADVAAPVRVSNFNLLAGTGDRINVSTGATVSTVTAGQTEYNPLSLNVSPAANNWRSADPLLLPRRGGDFTAPDINTAFLAYRGYIPHPTNPALSVPVIVPSYHRPQYMRRPGTNDPLLATDPAGQRWYDYNGWGSRSLRPHPDHRVQVQGSSAVSRFLTNAEAASPSLNPPMTQGFPMQPMDGTYTTSVPVFKTGRQGIWERIATSSGTFLTDAATYEYDVDNDQDGIPEGIWLDLDYPVQEDANGNPFVPLFSATIYDLDSLINLNAHGNLALNQALGVPALGSNPNGATGAVPAGILGAASSLEFFSRSNQGLGPAEVNPSWVFNSRPGTADVAGGVDWSPYTQMFTAQPAGYPGPTTNPPITSIVNTWKEASNMELAMILLGRVKFSAPSVIETIYPGRHGELSLLQSVATGTGTVLPRAGLTNSDDNNDSASGGTGYPTSWPYPVAANVLNSTFAWPLDFMGVGSYVLSTNVKNLDLFNNQFRFSRMVGQDTNSFVKWNTTNAPRLAGVFTLGDDPYETAYYRDTPDLNDSLFDAFDSAVLQMRQAKATEFNVSTRLTDLAPFNLNTSNSIRADDIRTKLTTVSSDRKQFSWPRSINRSWEYTASGGRYVFPPQFGTVALYSAADPLRGPVRKWLEIIENDNNTARIHRRIPLNSVIDGTAASPTVRPLVQHEVNAGANIATSTQERQARLDRQRLARDIYVLLYLFGGAVDNLNAATQPASALYSPDQLREMAQFAVNYVDAMDRDEVITRFVYDIDLSDGWNVDDANLPTSATVSGSSTFAQVYGIERQRLAINEVLAIKANQVEDASMVPVDHQATQWDDTTDQYLMYIELANSGPDNIDFTNGDYQIVVQPRIAMTLPDLSKARALTMQLGTIAPNGRYTIGGTSFDVGASAQPTDMQSVMKVDFEWTSGTPDFTINRTWIAPRNGVLDLDVVRRESTNGTTHRLMAGDANEYGAVTAGIRLLEDSMITNANDPLDVILYRRQYLGRTRPADATAATDNEWVEVDRLRVTGLREFELQPSTAYPNIDTELNKLRSFERNQPLDATAASLTQHPDGTPPTPPDGTETAPLDPYVNSIGAANPGALVTWTALQRHFDRDLANMGELFLIPLFGPKHLTLRLVDTRKSYAAGQQNLEEQYDSNNDGAIDFIEYSRTAGAKFLAPLYQSPVSTTPPAGNNHNRWHRVLELLEVPSRVNKNLSNETAMNSINRVPGKLNPNTIRHPEVLAAWLDDERVVNVDLTTNVSAPPLSTIDGLNWWDDFLFNRDYSELDPWYGNSPGQELSLPGLPGSRPFRSFSATPTVGAGNPALPSLIRSVDPLDQNTRLLFEVGSDTDHSNGALDPMTRERLIAKMSQNATTRSNTFVVFLTCKFFRATYDTANGNAVRIGAPLNDLYEPEFRGAYVVDRSKLEAAYDAGQGTFDFRKFIEAGQVLEK